ncbi:MAG: methyl-accepting chemotaxis protein [Solibacillus sp.]
MLIKNKLRMGFTISITVTVLACITIFIQLQKVDREYSQALDTRLPQTYATAELSRLAMAQATLVQNYILGKDTLEVVQKRRDEVNGLIAELDQALEKDNEAAQALLAGVKEKAKIMYASLDEAIQLKNTQGLEVAAAYYIDVAGVNVILFMDDATALTTEISTIFQQAQQEANATTQQSMVVTGIAIFVAILTGIIASVSLTKRIAIPLAGLERHVQEISKGNLRLEPLTIRSSDEIGRLTVAINDMKNTLTKLLSSLAMSADHLHQTSGQLTAVTGEVHVAAEVMLEGAKHGSENTQTMTTAAFESATAMDETATAVQKIAESSQEIHSFTGRTEELAKVGAQNIYTASHQMSSIYESTKLTTELIQKLSQQSKDIESITQVITSITDQTNLLALNAAIEAARAGEHGKGFAVVADEVRKLAEESNRSASQIVILTNEIQRDTKNVELAIEESLQNVEQGVGIIDEAGQSFGQIVNAIGQMRVQIEDVSAVTEQISATAEEVAASVLEIARSSQLTHDNAQQSYAATEQQMYSLENITSVAGDLNRRAQELQEIVGNYRV